MHNLRVKLIKKAMDSLNGAALALNMDLEGTFEYVVCNMLKVYHVVETEGHMRLIDNLGNMVMIRILDSPNPTLFERLIAKIQGKSEQKPAHLESEEFSALLEDEVIENVELQASIYGFARTDLYNRLVIIGCMLAIHLQDGQAFAYSKEGNGLGEIKFELR